MSNTLRSKRRRRASAGHHFRLSMGLLLMVLGSAVLPAPATAQNPDVEDEIKAVLVDMWAAIEEEDLDRYASHVHPDFTSFGETDLYLNEGKDYELRAYADYLSRVEGGPHRDAPTVGDGTG